MLKYVAILFMSVFLFFPSGKAFALEDQGRSQAMSRNDMEKALEDLKFALEEVKASEQTAPMELFNYRQVRTDMELMVKNLEKYLYPRVRLKQDAVPIRLDGRYFAEALKNGNRITAGPSGKDSGMTTVSVDSIPIPTDEMKPLSEDDVAALDKRQAELKKMREMSSAKPKAESKPKASPKAEPKAAAGDSPSKVAKPHVEKVQAKAHAKTVEKEKKPAKALDPTDVVYKWERFYNKKDAKQMAHLYGKEFRGGGDKLEKRIRDLKREFAAYPDAKIHTYDLEVTRGDDYGWKVRFSAEYSGKGWKEYSDGTFNLSRNLKILDEKWSAAVPVEDAQK